MKIWNWFKGRLRLNKELDPNGTRVVNSSSGMKVEVYNDWPDEMADVISETFRTGKPVMGTIDESGKVTITHPEDEKKKEE